MKITRHTGPDIRHALRAVRDSLGANAVILATRRTANGVEITAAMDFDADNVQDSTASVIPTPITAAPPAPVTPAAAPLRCLRRSSRDSPRCRCRPSGCRRPLWP